MLSLVANQSCTLLERILTSDAATPRAVFAFQVQLARHLDLAPIPGRISLDLSQLLAPITNEGLASVVRLHHRRELDCKFRQLSSLNLARLEQLGRYVVERDRGEMFRELFEPLGEILLIGASKLCLNGPTAVELVA